MYVNKIGDEFLYFIIKRLFVLENKQYILISFIHIMPKRKRLDPNSKSASSSSSKHTDDLNSDEEETEMLEQI